MKKIPIILISICLLSATKKSVKNDLSDCETALKACLSCENLSVDTIFIYSGRSAVRATKQVEKTKREDAVADVLIEKEKTKQNKDNNKKEVKITKSNNALEKATDKFLNFMQGLNGLGRLAVLFSLFGSGGAFLKLAQTLKKLPYFSWLPV